MLFQTPKHFTVIGNKGAWSNKKYGESLSFQTPKHFTVIGNLYDDGINNTRFITMFQTPKHFTVIGNSGSWVIGYGKIY